MRVKYFAFIIAMILCLITSACSSNSVSFDYKIKEEYAKEFTTEDAAILIDFLKVANELPNSANASKEEVEVEQAVIDMGSKATEHFLKKKGNIATEISRSLNIIGAVALDIKMAKSKHKMAKLDEKLGVESKYKEFKDITNLMKEKRKSAEKSLLDFKNYVN